MKKKELRRLKMVSNRNYTFKDIICIFLPVFIAAVLQYAVMAGDALIIFIYNLLSDTRTVRTRSMGKIITDAYNQPMNRAYISLAQYALFILCFGIWYYRAFVKKDDTTILDNIKSLITNKSRLIKTIIGLVVCGYMAQILVDCVLALVRPLFRETFENYDSLVSNVTGAQSSWLLILSVILLAPIGEELLFRGVIMNYAKRCMPAIVAIILQAALFGLYHGNIVQIIYAFVMGIVLGIVALRLGSIVYSIILHMAVNISIFLVPQFIYTNNTATIISCIISGIALIVLLIFILKSKNVKDDNASSNQ